MTKKLGFIDWLAKNKKWIFSGIGILIISIPCSLIIGGKKQRSIVNTLVTNTNSGTIIQGVEADYVSVINNSSIFNRSENDSSLKFEIYINGSIKPIVQHDIINIKEDRKIQIRVQNVGKVSAENVSLNVHFPLRSDQISYGSWQIQAPPINGKTKQEITGLLHLWLVSAGSIPEQSWLRSPPIAISKEIPSPQFTRRKLEQLGIDFSGPSENCPQDFVFHLLPFFISANSDHSLNFQFLVFLSY